MRRVGSSRTGHAIIAPMPRIAFDQLPPDARLWIFAAERLLTADEQTQVLGAVDGFIEQWAAHDRPLTTARDLRYDRFIFVAVDERAAGASGCSIDAPAPPIESIEPVNGAIEWVNGFNRRGRAVY